MPTFAGSWIEKSAFQVVGLRWQGTFAEAGRGEIRPVLAEIRQRLNEIPFVVNPDILLGLTFDLTEEGFTYYAAVEVERVEQVPDGMFSVAVPSLTYAVSERAAGDNTGAAYAALMKWLQNEGRRWRQDGVRHLEQYPMDADPYSDTPALTICLPVE